MGRARVPAAGVPRPLGGAEGGTVRVSDRVYAVLDSRGAPCDVAVSDAFAEEEEGREARTIRARNYHQDRADSTESMYASNPCDAWRIDRALYLYGQQLGHLELQLAALVSELADLLEQDPDLLREGFTASTASATPASAPGQGGGHSRGRTLPTHLKSLRYLGFVSKCSIGASAASCGAGESVDGEHSDRREERRMPSRDDGSASGHESVESRAATYLGWAAFLRSLAIGIVVRCGGSQRQLQTRWSRGPQWVRLRSRRSVANPYGMANTRFQRRRSRDHSRTRNTCGYVYTLHLRYSSRPSEIVVRKSKVGRITPRQRPTHLCSSHRHPSSGSACTYSVTESPQRMRGTRTGEQTALQPGRSHTV